MLLREFLNETGLDEEQVAKAIEESNAKDGKNQPVHPNSKVRDLDWLKSITSHLSPVANAGGGAGEEGNSGDATGGESQGQEPTEVSQNEPVVPDEPVVSADDAPKKGASKAVVKNEKPASPPSSHPEDFRALPIYGQAGDGKKPFVVRWIQTGQKFGVYATDETDAIAILRGPGGESAIRGFKTNPSFNVTEAK